MQKNREGAIIDDEKLNISGIKKTILQCLFDI